MTYTRTLRSLSLAAATAAAATGCLSVPGSHDPLPVEEPTPEQVAAVNAIEQRASAVIADSRTYVASRYALQIGGTEAGWLKSVEGGAAVGEVAIEQVGPDVVRKKHISGVRYDDITLAMDMDLSAPVKQWIKDFFDRKAPRKDGAIIAADYNLTERSRLNFFQALISEVTLPALDAAAKDAAKLTVKLSPEYTRNERKGGGPIKGDLSKQQKAFLPSNFRLTMDGLDAALAHVNKIEALTVKQKAVQDDIGEVRDYQKEPASLEIPNVVFTLPEAHAEALVSWHEEFVIKGNCSDDQEKNGAIELLSANRQTVLMRLNLSHCGITRVDAEKAEANSDSIRRTRVELYCEDMRLQ